MVLKFTKLKQNRIFQRVVDQIQAAILDGSLKPGNKLPSEMKLKSMFDTSRGSIREALRVLEQKGLIEIKVGANGGAIVKTVDTEKITESLELLIQSQKMSLDHLSEFREGVEGLVTALAAERATDGDRRSLKALLAEADNLFNKKGDVWHELVRLDTRLHMSIAEIARNPVYEAVLRMVHTNIHGYYERFSLKNINLLKENYQDLCDIVHAIETGQVNEARSRAQHHVRKFSRYMKIENQKHR
ncbi:MAG: FadR family transcriptional regulator [Desulfobacterales bacterium]|nr:GntR family transcriptional regulator [Deltaproteobacteria bacterium]NNL76999.1 FadR family transcriptional regulator [Desulfobacterales bacterium]